MSVNIQTGNVVKIQSGNRVLISAPGPQGPAGPGSGVTDGDKGDVTVTSSGAVWTIDNQAVTFAKMQHIGTAHLLGRHSSGSGDVQQIGIDGGLELQGANLRRSALTGDVTASAGSNSTTIANDAVTFAKMQNVSAASVLLGRGSTLGSGEVQQIGLGTGLAINATTLSVSNIAATQITGILPSDQLQSGRALATISEIVASGSGETGVNQTWRNEQRPGYGTGERLTWFSANGAYVLNWVSTTNTWYLAVFNGVDLWTSEDDVDYPWQITNWTTDTGTDPPPTFSKAAFADFVRSNGNGSAITNLNANNISSGTLGVPRGGTGATTLTANAVLLGNGTDALQTVAPGTTGNVLTSNGTTWTSSTITDQTAKLLFRANYQQVIWGVGTSNTTSGVGVTVNAAGMILQLNTNVTAGNRAQCQWPSPTTDTWLAAPGGLLRDIDWTRRVYVSFSTDVFQTTTNGTFFLRFGQPAQTSGNLTGRGVQIRFLGLVPYFGVHDGTTFTESAAQSAMTAQRQNDWLIVSLANGSVEFWRNGVLALTMTGGPTTPTNLESSYLAAEALNNADAATYRVHVSQPRIMIAP